MLVSAEQHFAQARNLIPLLEQEDFEKDVVAFFQHNGNMGRWAYSSPLYPNDPVNGVQLFKEWVANDPLYYVIKNEIALLQKEASTFAQSIGVDNVDVIADLGCGTEEAIIPKVFPLLRVFNKASYAPIDINQDYVDAAALTALSIRSENEIQPQCYDFMKDVVKIKGRALALMLGGTITNFNGIDGVREILSNVREMVGDDGHFIFTHDGNEDGAQIKRAYSGAKNQEMAVNIMHRIQRDLGHKIQGDFDPNAWQYVGVWDRNARTMRLCVTPTRKQEFSIGEIEISCEKDEIFEENSILKMHREDVDVLAEQTGWNRDTQVSDPNNWITAQHLRAM